MTKLHRESGVTVGELMAFLRAVPPETMCSIWDFDESRLIELNAMKVTAENGVVMRGSYFTGDLYRIDMEEWLMNDEA